MNGDAAAHAAGQGGEEGARKKPPRAAAARRVFLQDFTGAGSLTVIKQEALRQRTLILLQLAPGVPQKGEAHQQRKQPDDCRRPGADPFRQGKRLVLRRIRHSPHHPLNCGIGGSCRNCRRKPEKSTRYQPEKGMGNRAADQHGTGRENEDGECRPSCLRQPALGWGQERREIQVGTGRVNAGRICCKPLGRVGADVEGAVPPDFVQSGLPVRGKT